MIRNRLFLFVLMGCSFFAFLSNVQGQELPNVVLPSPQTRELNKYINFPVDLSTGIPEISIPLYTIKTKGIEIPIILNYHASGIKVGQEDGNVGLGWSLSCDYRISRSIYGFADTKTVEMSPDSYYSTVNGLTGIDLEKYLGRFVSDALGSVNPIENLPPRSGNLLDGEYDQFDYLIPPYGGKFIISDRVRGTINQINPSNLKIGFRDSISYDGRINGIIGFKIKDENQNVFDFGEWDNTNLNKVLEANSSPLNIKDATAWALTKIRTKYGEKIDFSYNSKSITTKFIPSFSVVVLPPRTNTFDTWDYSFDGEFKNSTYDIFSLAQIKTEVEKIEFVENSIRVEGSNKIHQINILDSTSGNLIKQVQFFFSDTYIYPNSYTFLDSIKVFAANLVEYEKYSFEYYDRDFDFSSHAFVPDHWGYFKMSSSISKLLHRELGNDYADIAGEPFGTTQIGSYNLYNQGGFSGHFDNRFVNDNPRFLSLKSILYPTGGISCFEYEGNRIIGKDDFPIYSGGIRIGAIKKYLNKSDYNDNNPNLYKLFKYGKDGSGGGYTDYFPNYNDFRKESLIIMESNLGAPRIRRLYSSQSLGEASSRTFYKEVWEKLLVLGGETGVSRSIFKSIDPFSITGYTVPIPFLMYNSYGPNFIHEYREWKKPNLESKLYYNSEGTLLKKEYYSYQTKNFQYFLGLKVRPYAMANSIFNENLHLFTLPNGSAFYNQGPYSISSGNDLLIKKEEITYSGQDSIVLTTSFNYNDLNQLVKETNIDSRGNHIEKNTKYAYDAPNESITWRMLQENDINRVIEENVLINNILERRRVNSYIELPNNIFVPTTTSELDHITNTMNDLISYHQYDSMGNILSLSKSNDSKTSYLWSYRGKFPIAEIKGPSYDEIESVLGVANILNFRNKVNPSKIEIDNFLFPLNTLIKNGNVGASTMTSFSYHPIWGVKSETDVTGRTTYYEYDSFGRIKLVKGDQGEIGKKIDYNYRNR